ncbi:putative transcription factor interactor and regulator Znf-B family [Helianthus annuus]|nr:putative transcription factor interactor and regulator Znf-B family [Helianthus annuus]KAJ0598861.1 putative transcription factor interactor and regulator Znf-B family [Helianthus annuus]
MKIQCDVCEASEAVVFCTADEASLCSACDHRVHHANKLANKHPRFPLLQPSFKDSPPRCDICQERRAFLFCKEDRAILCRECDVPIHTANEHTQKHTRFLLTGVKLSCYDHQTPSSSNSNASIESSGFGASIHQNSDLTYNNNNHSNCSVSHEEDASVSEYLVETLPGWHVDEFLDPYGFSKF